MMQRILTLVLLLVVTGLAAQAQSAPSACPIQVVDFKLAYVPRAWVKNLSAKPIHEIRFLLAHADSTDTYHWREQALDWRQPINPGDTRDYDWPRQMYRDNYHVGSMLIPAKVVFADGSVWRPGATPSGDIVSVDGSCSGQFWVNKSHPATRTFQLPANLWQ
jgi:hypothetical protein